MNSLTIDNMDIELDEYGFMQDPEKWNEDVARAMAKNLGISELTDAHWSVIHYAREHCLKHHTLIWMEQTCHTLNLGHNCIRRLFRGPIRVCKIAGMPDPGEEARTYMLNEEPPEKQ